MPIPRKLKTETWKEYIRKLTRHYISEGYPAEQAYAIAHSVVRKKKREQRKRS